MDYFLADDLSGALDASAAFHHAGRRVRIALTLEATETTDAMEGEVLAITTETRNASPNAAAAAIERILARARARGGRLLFKKIDSTMRGPVVAELSALLQTMPEMHVLFTPANPAVGRTVRDGVLRVQGVPVAETDFARDPVNPVRESSIWKLLGPVANERVHLADAERQRDLNAAVAEMNTFGEPWVGVGSGALARAVAGQLEDAVPVAPVWPQIAAGGILMVCGSAHAANRTQAEYLWRERNVAVHDVALDGGGVDTSALLSGREGASLLVETVRGDSAAALRAITAAAAETIERHGVRRMFITGGETAFALCGALGIATLSYLAEIEPGVSLSCAETARGPLLLAVKPGGFGDARTWVRVWDRLKAAGLEPDEG